MKQGRMKSGWRKYLLYISLATLAGLLLYILVETVNAKNTGFETKTLWDWMDLFIIPLFLAGGAFFLNRSEKEIERQTAESRAKLEREIAIDSQQDGALQSYLDRMANLLLIDKLRTTKKKEVPNVAKIQTLTVLRGLDGKRKRMVLFFIREAELIHKENPIIDLTGADFGGADLSDFGLKGVNPYGVDLSSANLSHAYLGDASLHFANLSGADLGNAKITNEQLETVKSLKGAIMPDGSKHD